MAATPEPPSLEPREPVTNRLSWADRELDRQPEVLIPRPTAARMWEIRKNWILDVGALGRIRASLPEDQLAVADELLRELAGRLESCAKEEITQTLANTPFYVRDPTDRWDSEAYVRFSPAAYGFRPGSWSRDFDLEALYRFLRGGSSWLCTFRGMVNTALEWQKAEYRVTTSSFFDVPPERKGRLPEKIYWQPPAEGGPRLVYERDYGIAYPPGAPVPPDDIRPPQTLPDLRPNIALSMENFPAGGSVSKPSPPEVLVDYDTLWEALVRIHAKATPVHQVIEAMHQGAFEAMEARVVAALGRLHLASLRCVQHDVLAAFRHFGVYVPVRSGDDKYEPPPPGTYYYRHVRVRSVRILDANTWLLSSTFAAPDLRVRIGYYHVVYAVPAQELRITDDSWFKEAPQWQYHSLESQDEILYQPTNYLLYGLQRQ